MLLHICHISTSHATEQRINQYLRIPFSIVPSPCCTELSPMVPSALCMVHCNPALLIPSRKHKGPPAPGQRITNHVACKSCCGNTMTRRALMRHASSIVRP